MAVSPEIGLMFRGLCPTSLPIIPRNAILGWGEGITLQCSVGNQHQLVDQTLFLQTGTTGI